MDDKITITDIETAKTLEFNLIHNRYTYSSLKLMHGFDKGCFAVFTYENGKCYIQYTSSWVTYPKEETPYPVWVNEILYRVHFGYDACLTKRYSED